MSEETVNTVRLVATNGVDLVLGSGDSSRIFWPKLLAESQAWAETIENIEDKGRVSQLGISAYGAFYGEDVSTHYENLEFLRILAGLLEKAFSALDSIRVVDLKECLEGSGRFFETTFWEAPSFRGEAHQILEREISANRAPTLLELLLIAHDLEGSIRPNFLRILWIAILATGDKSTKYSAVQTTPEGAQGSLGYAVRQLSTWLDSEASGVLSPVEIVEVRSFLNSMSGIEPEQIAIDDLRNWPAHRDFMIGAKTVVLNFHPYPGRRIPTDRQIVTTWRRQTLGLMALLHGFKVMFLVHAVAQCGVIVPAFLPE